MTLRNRDRLPSRHQPMFDQLAQAVTIIRDTGEHAGDITVELLTRDTAHRRFIGLPQDDDAAFYWDVQSRKVMRVPLAPNIDGLAVSMHEYLGDPAGDEQWVSSDKSPEWGWVHPRYRWLFE